MEKCLANRGEVELGHRRFLKLVKNNAVNKIRILNENSVKVLICTRICIFTNILSKIRIFDNFSKMNENKIHGNDILFT